jgi:hypothetical protein
MSPYKLEFIVRTPDGLYVTAERIAHQAASLAEVRAKARELMSEMKFPGGRAVRCVLRDADDAIVGEVSAEVVSDHLSAPLADCERDEAFRNWHRVRFRENH